MMQENYGKTVFEKMKIRLNAEYGISFEQASSHMQIPEIKEILHDEISNGFEILNGFDSKLSEKTIEVKDDSKIDELLTFLGCTQCRKILEMTSSIPISSYEIAQNVKGTKSTTYRKIAQLEKLGLLQKSNPKQTKTKPSTQYVNTTESIVVTLQKNSKTTAKIITKTNAKLIFPKSENI